MRVRRKAKIAIVLFGIGSILALIWIWETVGVGNTSIVMFGRVRDSHNSPISGVRIHYEVSRSRFFTVVTPFSGPEADLIPGITSTDQNGDFEIHSWGTGLAINEFRKEGYFFEDRSLVIGSGNTAASFSYSNANQINSLPSVPARRRVYTLWASPNR